MDEQEMNQGPEGESPETAPAEGPPMQAGVGGPPPLPPELQAANASKEERTWAMLCHLLALAGFVFPFGNILGPLIIWLIKRDESRFVNFHGRQSLWFQVWATVLVVCVGIISIPLSFICIG